MRAEACEKLEIESSKSFAATQSIASCSSCWFPMPGYDLLFHLKATASSSTPGVRSASRQARPPSKPADSAAFRTSASLEHCCDAADLLSGVPRLKASSPSAIEHHCPQQQALKGSIPPHLSASSPSPTGQQHLEGTCGWQAQCWTEQPRCVPEPPSPAATERRPPSRLLLGCWVQPGWPCAPPF